MCILELTNTVFVLQIKMHVGHWAHESQISKQHICVSFPFYFLLTQIHCVDAKVPKCCGLNSVPQKFQAPSTCECDLVLKQVFADDQGKVSSLGWAMTQYNCVLLRRGNLDNDTCTQAECHVNMKAEISMMYLRVKQCQKIAGKLPKLDMEHTFLGMERILPLSTQKEPTLQALGFELPSSQTEPIGCCLTSQAEMLCSGSPGD